MSERSAEEIVRERWPDAFALEFAGAWQIGSASYGFPVMPLPGERIPRYLSKENCDTESDAWADAAARIKAPETEPTDEHPNEQTQA